MDNDKELRKQLVNLLTVTQSSMSFEDAVKDFPVEHINTKPPNVEYTFWHLVEHLRLTQLDILDYIRELKNYKWKNWPADYWPSKGATTDKQGWETSIKQFLEDRQALVDIVKNPKTDLYAQIPHGENGHNILREILIVGEHNAYHVGELGILRQIMDNWAD